MNHSDGYTFPISMLERIDMGNAVCSSTYYRIYNRLFLTANRLLPSSSQVISQTQGQHLNTRLFLMNSSCRYMNCWIRRPVQIAKSFGAEVTGVCSTKNADMVLSIGADHVIDYTQEDFTQSGQRYDLILDNVASRSFSDLRRSLTPQGIIIPNSGHGGMGYVVKAYVLSAFMRQQGRMFMAVPNNEDLVVLKELIESGKVTPVIDRTYPLSETPEAFRYLDKEHAKGKVVITV